ncbi:TPA: hypothetical protein CPT85_08735 [Candidatus Gastranaerophilales bacterium HUM_21]|nr:MAG TPA: hypothetical protein CPT85_08735 [Candidatus Gastranaerophilales bacterium HUM_21]
MGQSCPSLAATPKWKFWQKNKQMEQPVPEENEENRQDSLWENLQPDTKNLQAEKTQSSSDI